MMGAIPAEREGRRERKRRETRARIADAAMSLFLDRGFSAVTIDEIAEAADVSKRSFFDYFPTKEDVVDAWQDKFEIALIEAVARRPAEETPTVALERALKEALDRTATPESFAITDLIRATPALYARDQLKYIALEDALATALLNRDPEADGLGVRLLSMIAIGALRVGTEVWHATGGLTEKDLESFTDRVLQQLWAEVAKLAPAASASDR